MLTVLENLLDKNTELRASLVRRLYYALPTNSWCLLPIALKWFNADGGEPETYEGQRDLEAFTTL